MGRKITPRPVKCAITGQEGLSTEFYRGPNKKWYKDEQTYLVWKRNYDTWHETVDYFCTNFLGYEPGAIFPTLLVRKIKSYEKRYGYEKLLACIKQQTPRILQAIRNKDFENDTHKMQYIFAIINNYINETKLSKSPVTLQNEFLIEEVHDLQTAHDEKDIRKWLDEEDDT